MMYTKLLPLVSCGLVLILAFTSYGIGIGDFENTMDGWTPVEPNAITSFSTTGATSNQNSLRLETIAGNQNVLTLDLIALGLVDEFRDNLKISIDVTRLTSEWTDMGSSWCDIVMGVNAGSINGEIVWDYSEEMDGGGVWIPDLGDGPITFTYDYSLAHNQIHYDELEYLELVLITNWGGYDPGGVYYIDNIQMFGAGAAYDPIPADGEREMPVSTTISWTPGVYAQTHDVYFGTSLENVTNATRENPLGVLKGQDYSSNSYDPGELISGTSYFWRIDEVKDSDIWKGEVWSFTTVYPGTGVVMGDWEDSLDGWTLFAPGAATLGFSTTGATLNNKSLKVTVPSSFWILALSLNARQIEALKANDLFAIDVTWVASEWEGQSWSQVQMIAINSDGTGWQDGGQRYPVPLISDTAYPDDPGAWPSPEFPDIDTRTLTWDYTAVNVADIEAWGNIHISQNHDPEAGPGIYYFDNARLLNVRRASNPQPAYQETDVRIEPVLKWTPGRYAVSHNVYLGTNIDEISDVNIANLAGYPNVIYGTVDDAILQPTPLEFNTKYYWRVDEVNEAHPDQLWKGDIWNFTTGNYIVVDDFESYNDINPDQEGSRRIYMVWTDGYDNPSVNGSTIGYPDPSIADGEHFVETKIVHGGNQSCPLFYDNTVAGYSEATVNTNDLTVKSDWTRGDVKTLRVWFYGDPNNATTEQLYVKVNSTKVIYNGDAANLAKPQWTQWDIDLPALGINLTDISQFGIGLERNGALGTSGVIFFDDIRLYRQEQ